MSDSPITDPVTGPITKERLATVFEYAGIEVSPERFEQKAPEYLGFLRLIRQTNIPDLGETVPQTAFKASWE
jgi:hypothetical protein